MVTRLGEGLDTSVEIRPRGGGPPIGTFHTTPDTKGSVDMIESGYSRGKFFLPHDGLIAPDGFRVGNSITREIAAWRYEARVLSFGGELVWGPLVDVKHGVEGVSIDFGDWTHWWKHRRAMATNLTGEATAVFQSIHDTSMAEDTSPNFGLATTPGDIEVTRFIDGADGRMLGDVLSDFARADCNWVSRGRTVYVRSASDRLTPSFSLSDRDFLGEVFVHHKGRVQANRVIMIGKGGLTVTVEDPVLIAADGLLEKTFVEQSMGSESELLVAGKQRLAQLRIPVFIELPKNASLSPDAAVSIGQLTPGNVCTVTVANQLRPIKQNFRVDRIKFTFNGRIRVTFAPIAGES